MGRRIVQESRAADAAPNLSGGHRLAVVVRSLEVGGAEGQAALLAVGLAQRGWLVSVVTLYDGGGLRAELEANGIPVVTLAKTGRWDLFRPAARLRRFGRQFRPEAVYSFQAAANLLSLSFRMTGAPPLVWAFRGQPNRGRGRAARLIGTIESRLTRAVDACVFNASSAREAYGQRIQTDVIRVIPNGVDLSRFRPDPVARAAQRGAWNVGTSVVIGIVGRFDAVKGHETLVRAVAELQPDLRQGVALVVVGIADAAQRAAFMEMADRNGLGCQLVVEGIRTDMEAVYPAFDVLVLPSMSEGLPNVILEALASGTRCIGTRVGDIERVLPPTCPTVDPADPAALREALEGVMGDLASPLASADRLRDHVTEHYSLRRSIDDTEQLLLDVIAATSKRSP